MSRRLLFIISALTLLVLATACEDDRPGLETEGDVLDSPIAVAYHDGYLYVTNANMDQSGAGEGFLLIVDARMAVSDADRGSAVVGKRTTEPFLADLTIDPDRELAYVASRNTNEILVFDLDDPTDPRLVDMDPDRSGSQGLRAGDEPYGAVLRPDGRYLYATNVSSGDVSVIDLEAGELARSILLSSGLVAIRMQPGSDYAWVTNRRVNSVSLIDTVENRFEVSFQPVAEGATLFNDSRGIDFAPDGSRAYVAIQDPPMVIVVDTDRLPERPDQAVREYVPMDSNPYGVAVSPDGGECWVTNFDSKRLLVIDTQFDNVIARVDLGSGPTDILIVQFEEDDPEQYYVFVTHYFGHSMAIIDGVTRENLGSIR